MVREDIVTALKNAIERGYSIDLAVHSLINAGYKPSEVEEAADFLSGGNIPVPKAMPQPVQQPTPQIPQLQSAMPATQTQKQQAIPTAPRKKPLKIILLVIILLALIGALIFVLRRYF